MQGARFLALLFFLKGRGEVRSTARSRSLNVMPCIPVHTPIPCSFLNIHIAERPEVKQMQNQLQRISVMSQCLQPQATLQLVQLTQVYT
jgi:hypothetical protein